jgi:monomeric type NADP-dependent isocitrate dehydrogenase
MFLRGAGVRRVAQRALSTTSAALEPKIIYTLTDEAPALATFSLLPIVNRFTGPAGVKVEACDISVATRILALFPERLQESQRVTDTLAQLGELSKAPTANIIKLPNVSASVPQLLEAISELQAKGYALPPFPADPQTDEEREVRRGGSGRDAAAGCRAVQRHLRPLILERGARGSGGR